MKKILCTLAVLLAGMLCLSACQKTRPADEIIEDIIIYHGCYKDEASKKVDSLFKELERSDKEQAELWKGIMDYWEYLDKDMELNEDEAPEGLPDDDSLCIVVLGYQLNPDGSMQDELVGRLEAALRCANAYPNAFIACTGGGTAKENPDATEAGQMKEWLLSNGVSEERIILEDKSRSTAQNAELTYKILLNDYPQVDSVVIVSSSYHIAWGALLFEAGFRKSAAEAQTPEIHVISNCAYKFYNKGYPEDQIFRWQTGGLLQLIGDNEKAREFYTNTYESPEL